LISGCAVPPAASVDASKTALPRIVAHRGGTGDAPENTLEAIRLALKHHADAMWLTVQLSKDGVPVLYRPADLAALTDAKGPVSARTAGLCNFFSVKTIRRFHGDAQVKRPC
jgi:glycerophosphoryl diester phosphodiesterase